jgi:hypothetical protein
VNAPEIYEVKNTGNSFRVLQSVYVEDVMNLEEWKILAVLTLFGIIPISLTSYQQKIVIGSWFCKTDFERSEMSMKI